MCTTKSHWIYTAVLIVLMVVPLEAGQKLRYKFEPEKKYSYATTVNNKTTGQGMGQEFTVTAVSNLDYTVVLDTVQDGLFKLIVTLDKFVNKINMPQMGFNDSTVSMTEWEGKRVRVIMNDLGKVMAIEAIDQIPPSKLGMMLRVGPTEMFRRVFFELPDRELGIDSAWKNTDVDTSKQMGMDIVVKPNLEFKIAAQESKNNMECLKIVFSGTNQTSGSGSMQGMDISVDGSTKISGTVYFAPKEGVFISADQSNDAEATQTFSGAQSGAQTTSSVIAIKSVLK
ncbi:MAG TPA: hypothetical protein VMU30_08195 [Bacteroidota bacterium]|nr:hypothetical protein [Bacteroidota bacterium]